MSSFGLAYQVTYILQFLRIKVQFPFFQMNYPKLQFNCLVEYEDKSCNEILDFQDLGFFCFEFRLSKIKLRSLNVSFYNQILMIAFDKEQDIEINVDSQNLSYCPSMYYYGNNRFILHCNQSEFHYISFITNLTIVHTILFQNQNDCHFGMKIMNNHLFAYHYKCLNWEIFKIDLENNDQVDLKPILLLKIEEISQLVLENISFVIHYFYLIFSYKIYYFDPFQYQSLTIYEHNNSFDNKSLIDFRQGHIFISESDIDEYHFENNTKSITFSKQHPYKQFFTYGDSKLIIFQSYISIVCQKVFRNDYQIEVNAAIAIENIPYYLMNLPNNTIISFRLLLHTDTYLDNEQRYKYLFSMPIKQIDQQFKRHIHNVEYLFQNQTKIQYHSILVSFSIFNFHSLLLDRFEIFSGIPCSSKVIQKQDKIIESIDSGQILCSTFYFNKNKFFFSFFQQDGSQVIIQQGKQFITQQNCSSQSNILFIFIENELSHNNIFIVHSSQNILIVREQNQVTLFRIVLTEISKIKQYFILNHQSIQLYNNAKLYMSSQEMNSGIVNVVIDVVSQETQFHQNNKCRLLFIHDYYCLYQCNNQVMLQLSTIYSYYQLTSNIYKIEIISYSYSNRFVIYELSPQEVLIARLFLIRYPDIIYCYTLPLYSLTIINPIISQVYSRYYSFIVQDQLNNYFIFIYNIENMGISSLISVIQTDNLFYVLDQDIITVVNQGSLMNYFYQKLQINFNRFQFRTLQLISNITFQCQSFFNHHEIEYNLSFVFQENLSELQVDNNRKMTIEMLNNQIIKFDIGHHLLGPVEDLQIVKSKTLLKMVNPIVYINEEHIYCSYFKDKICFLNSDVVVFTKKGYQKINFQALAECFDCLMLYDNGQIIMGKGDHILNKLKLYKYDIATNHLTHYSFQNEQNIEILSAISVIQYSFQLIGNMLLQKISANYYPTSYLFYLQNQTIIFLQSIEIREENMVTLVKLSINSEIYTLIQYKEFVIELMYLSFDNKLKCQSDIDCLQVFDLNQWNELSNMRKHGLDFHSISTLQKTDSSYYFILIYKQIGYIFEVSLNEYPEKKIFAQMKLIGILEYPYQGEIQFVTALGAHYIFIKFSTSPLRYLFDLSQCSQSNVYKIDSIYSIDADRIEYIRDNLFMHLEIKHNLMEKEDVLIGKLFEVNPWTIACDDIFCQSQIVELRATNQISNVTFQIEISINQSEQRQYFFTFIIISFTEIVIIVWLIKKTLQKVKYNAAGKLSQ